LARFELFFSDKARNDLHGMDSLLQELFVKHAEKLLSMPPRRHLKFGIPFNVEDVTKQARMVYETRGETLAVLRCFASHKDCEKWFKSFR